MKEKLTFLMLMIMASALFSSCDQKMKELKEQVDKFNKACPMSFGDIMTLNSTMLDNDVVEMKLTANETVASISALNNHQEEAKEILTMSLSKETSNVLVDKIINADANLRIIIVGGQSNEEKPDSSLSCVLHDTEHGCMRQQRLRLCGRRLG